MYISEKEAKRVMDYAATVARGGDSPDAKKILQRLRSTLLASKRPPKWSRSMAEVLAVIIGL